MPEETLVAANVPASDGPGSGDRSTPDTILTVEELVTHFRTRAGLVRAVDGVSFSLERGKTVGIVGESGSGKTVLSRSIMNLLPKQNLVRSGHVMLGDQDIVGIRDAEMRKIWAVRMAMVFQDPLASLNPVVRVGNQITDVLRKHQALSRADAKARAIELLSSVRIPEAARRFSQYPHELSGGMRQRVIIAIALSCDPDILFADEPTTALDVTVQAAILDLLAEHQRERDMGVVLVTHDLGIMASRADEIIVMYAGQVVEKAPTQTLLSSTRMPYAEALLGATPRLSAKVHARLATIPGRPPNPAKFPSGCRFAARCSYAQERCLTEMPPLVADEGTTDHEYRCWFPVNTPAGTEALERNRARGETATGLPISAASSTGA